METGKEFLNDGRNQPVWHGNGPILSRMDTQIGEHHWRDGLTFRRMPAVREPSGKVHDEGSVRIRRWYKIDSGRWSYQDVAYIPRNEWESIVREVAAPPASAPEVEHG